MIRIFEQVFEMGVVMHHGDAADPDQVWLCGGLQLIPADADNGPGNLNHVCIATDELEKVIELAQRHVVGDDPRGAHWLRFPGNLVIEVLEASSRRVAISRILDPRA